MQQKEKTNLSDLSKVTKGAGITLTGNMVGKGILLFYTIFLARVLGANDLGLYLLGITIVRLMTILSILGLDTGVVRYVAIYNGRNDLGRMKGTVIISAIITMLPSIVFIGLTFLLGDFVATFVFHKPELGSIIKLLSLSIPFESLMRILLASTRGLKLMQYVAYTEHLTRVGIRFLFAIFFLFGMGLGLEGVALAYVASSIFAAGLAFYYANKLISVLDTKTRPLFEIKNLLNFSIPMVFTVLIYDLMSRVDILMLGVFVSSSEVGIYTIAVRIIMLAQVVFMAFQPIFQPFVAELHDKKEFERLSNLLKVLTQWSVTISLPVFLSLLLFPGFFLHFFGNEFVKGSGCLSILVVAFLFSSVSSLPASIIFMAGRSDLSLINNLATLIINATLNYLLIPRFGIIGAAFATGISFVFLSFIRIIEVYILMQIHPLKLDIWKPLAAGAGSLIPVFLLQSSQILQGYSSIPLLLSIFLVLYVSLVHLLKLDEEMVLIKQKIKEKLTLLFR
ncbi:hypothetical protein C6A36_00010 [Desulfobacteraceae bacterium SEEP-SAG10]|nr:hypothetical protein C6A36_00010 [Desulfobacteraceae bacterium SEEP-SAG10]